MISVIVPVYNIADYIGDCIESILAQTYRDLEIILVDDGSTDESGEICERYAKKDERIRVIHKENGGASTARNKGINEATGEYLFFVDGDDLIHPSCIQSLLTVLEETGSDIVQCKTYAFLNVSILPPQMPKRVIHICTGREMCEHYLLGTYGSDTTVVWNKLYRRQVFQTIRFPEGIIYEDDAIIGQIYWYAEKIALTNEPLAYYRSKRVNSVMHSEDRRWDDMIMAEHLRADFFHSIGEKDLYEQSLYLLCNSYTRIRACRGEVKDTEKLIADHKAYVKQVWKSNLSISKRMLCMIGVNTPGLWHYLWKMRNRMRG